MYTVLLLVYCVMQGVFDVSYGQSGVGRVYSWLRSWFSLVHHHTPCVYTVFSSCRLMVNIHFHVVCGPNTDVHIVVIFHTVFVSVFPFSALALLVGQQKGVWPVKSWMFV